MKKYFTISVLVVLALSYVWGLWASRSATPEVIVTETSSAVVPTAPQEVAVTTEETMLQRASLATTSVVVAGEHASLTVLNRSYDLVFQKGEQLEVAMKTLARTGDFSFSGSEFSGFGYFVDTLNGQKNSGGKYWILYVNGVLSGVGISQLTVQPGDRIEWRYESSK